MDAKLYQVELVQESSLQRAMLFEIAVAVAEMIRWEREEFDLNVCILRAIQRQRKYYDAKLSETLTDSDRNIVFRTAKQSEYHAGQCGVYSRKCGRFGTPYSRIRLDLKLGWGLCMRYVHSGG